MDRVCSGVVHGVTWVNRGVAMSNKTDRIAPDQPGATTDLTGANTVATRTVPDYPGLKNRPGPSRLTPEILSILKPPGRCLGPCQIIPDCPGSNTDLTTDRPNVCAGRSRTVRDVGVTDI